MLRFDEGGKLETLQQARDRGHGHESGSPRRVRIAYHRGSLFQSVNDSLYALDAKTGRRKWVHSDPDGNRLLFVTYAPELDPVMVASTSWDISGVRWPGSKLTAIVAMNAQTGQQVWRNDGVTGQAISQLVYAEGRLAYFSSAGIGAVAIEKGSGIDGAWIGVLNAKTGKLKWSRNYLKDPVPLAKKQHFAGWGFNLALLRGKAYLTNQNDILEFDADTGKLLKLLALPTLNARCTRPRLTVKYHLVGFGSFVAEDLLTTINQDIARGGCTVDRRQGLLPW